MKKIYGLEICTPGQVVAHTPAQEVACIPAPGGDAYTGPGGGMYSGPGGGLYTGPGGGLYTGPSGGMYTGPDSEPFMAVFPPWPLFVVELRKMGLNNQADIIAKALNAIGWRLTSRSRFVRVRSLDSLNRRMLRIICAVCVCPLALRSAADYLGRDLRVPR